MSWTICDYFTATNQSPTGVVVNAYDASRFETIPAQGSLPPGAPDAGPVVTGPAFGGPGAFILLVPTDDSYYCSFNFGGVLYWKYYNSPYVPSGVYDPYGAAAEVQDNLNTEVTLLAALTGATFTGNIYIANAGLAVQETGDTVPRLLIADSGSIFTSLDGATAPPTKGFYNFTFPFPGSNVPGFYIKAPTGTGGVYYPIFEIDDHTGAPIFGVENAGGATVYGDNLSVANGSLTKVIQLNMTNAAIYSGNGTALLPAFGFMNDNTTGLWYSAPFGVATLNFAAAAANLMSLNAFGLAPVANGTLPLGASSFTWSQLFLANGAAAAPAVSWADNTGIFRSAPSGLATINFSLTGTNVMSLINTVGLSPVADNAIALGGIANRWSQIIGRTHQAGNGTALLPAFAFNNDLTSGLYLSSVGNPALAAGGALTFPIPTAAPVTGQEIVAISASATAWQTPIGKQVEYNAVTATWTYSCTAAVWTKTVATGTAPSITLPNDGYTYRVELHVTEVVSATGGIITIGLGTSTTNIYTTSQVNGNASQEYTVYVVAHNVTGSGQTITPVVQDASTATVSFGAAAGGGTNTLGPAELVAYRVA